MFSRCKRTAAAAAAIGPIAFVAFGAFTSTRASACPAPQAPWAQEYGVGTAFPVDTALTYNGRRAAVRSAFTTGTTSVSYANGVTFWDLTTATAPAPPGWLATFNAMGEGIVLAQGGYQPSDLIELTNTRCVAIGSGYSQQQNVLHDQTYIDLFDVSAGVAPGLLATYTMGQDASQIPQNQWAGYTNDVVITRDGAYAIINSDNNVFRLDLSGLTDPPPLLTLNIGEVPYGPFPTSQNDARNLCTPNGAVDSVAVNNDVAVVTTSRVYSGTRTTWVYLIDIASWTVLLEHQVQVNPPVEGIFPPHDVAITPNGQMAVVTSDRMVSLFDLTTYQFVATHYDQWASRQYQVQVDSVELTDGEAVVLSDNVQLTPRWQIDVFKISLSPPGLGLVASYPDTNPPAASTRAHDLEISKGGVAVVRTSYEDVLINNLVAPVTPNEILSPTGSNAHEYLNYPGFAPWTAFSSDSVVTGSPTEDTKIAVTIGAVQSSPGVWQGYVDFIDVSAGTLLAQRSITSTSVQNNGALPLDLTMTRDRTEVAVRCADPYADSPGVTGADVTCFSLATFNSQGYGGTGYVMGVDSIAAGIKPSNNRKRVISTSEDPFSAPPDGKVHLVDRP